MDEKDLPFTKTILNIHSNFTLHELVESDDKDLPWFNTKLKSVIRENIKTCKVLRKNIENNHQIEELKSLQNRLKYVKDGSKHNYYSKVANKLANRNGPC